MRNKFIIGLAQADRNYGLNNKKNFTDVINSSLKNKFIFYDSSISYKNRIKYEKKISENKNTKIITKSSFNFPKDINFKKKVETEIKNLLKENKRLYAILIHDPLLPLNDYKWKIVFSILKKYKKNGYLKKIGVSVYNKYELNLILKKFNPDIIQFPLNLFNQSFKDKEYLKGLKTKNIELHARSIFLQGILLKKPSNIGKYFNIWENEFRNLDIFLKENKITNLEACIKFIIQIKYIDKFVIGVDNGKQLEKIIKVFESEKYKKNKLNFSSLASNDQNLIDPRYWKKGNLPSSIVHLKKWINVKKIVLNGGLLLSKRPEQFLPGGWPAFYKKAKSCFIWDNNGKKFLDFSLMGVGTNILGYSNNNVNSFLKKNIDQGSISTLNSNYDFELSKKLLSIHPWADMATYARTGGEANAIAIRISRVFSKKDQVAICGYHGWHDWYLSANLQIKNNLNKIFLKGLNTYGIPKNLEGMVHPFKYNDINGFKNLIKKNPNIGTVFMEVQRNEKPKKNFLKNVRKITEKRGIVLIFDECTSGFRENYGGLHLKYKINPDIAVFGKSIGNGIPITAIIGRKNIMQSATKSFISSTFWTDSTGPASAVVTLNEMKKIKSWKKICALGKKIKKFWRKLSIKYNLQLEISGLDSMPLFNFKDDLNLYYKTYITQELLKKKILATNSVYCCVDHKIYLKKYFIEFEKIFKKISYIKKNESILKYLEFPVSMPGFQRLN